MSFTIGWVSSGGNDISNLWHGPARPLCLSLRVPVLVLLKYMFKCGTADPDRVERNFSWSARGPQNSKEDKSIDDTTVNLFIFCKAIHSVVYRCKVRKTTQEREMMQ